MNPFSYGTVVREPFFFDRKEEKTRIVKTLSGGNNMVLYAPRRYGKTSLIVRAMEELKEMGFVCIYFDFMTVYSRESFIEGYSRAIMSVQSNIKQTMGKVASLVKGIRPKLTFDSSGYPEFSIDFVEEKISNKTMDEVIDLPEILSGGEKKYIIAFDEFQEIEKLNGENFEKLLRSKIQHHQNVSYIFFGSRTHILKNIFNSKNRAFFNSTSSMSLGVLPEKETIEYMQERFGRSKIYISEETAIYLIKKAGGIPYYIQFLASEVWQYVVEQSGQINEDAIKFCAERVIILKSDYYSELFDRQTAYQKKLLKAIAEDGRNIYSKEYSNKFRLSAVSTTQRAIIGLIRNGIIEKAESEFRFEDPFFKEYIKHYA